MEINIKIDYKAVEEIVRRAGRMIKEAYLSSDFVQHKEGDANFVTSYDVAIQKFLIDELHGIVPEAAFFGEEETEGNTREKELDGLCFLIDPIDGTTNFMFRYNYSCVSVGLAYARKMIAGFVYNPYVDEMFTAVRGEGAYLNGNRIHMPDSTLEDGIASFGCARYNAPNTDLLFRVVQEMFNRSLAVRCGGSAALDLCRVAAGASVVYLAGASVVYLEMKLNPYDYAAASIIIEEAGGVITQIDGSKITLDQPCSILGAAPKAAGEVRDMIECIYSSTDDEEKLRR